MKASRKILVWLMGGVLSLPCGLGASEVLQETPTAVVVREHPKTGKPYVSIVPGTRPVKEDIFQNQKDKISRPDYRMLDPKVKKGEVPYEGPYSDRKKVYILAATLAALGTAGGIAGTAAVSTAAGSGASGGAGVYLAGGTAVVTGTAAGAHWATKSDPDQDDFSLASESRLLETEDKKDFESSDGV